MARGFLVTVSNGPAVSIERPYEIVGKEIILLVNRKIRIPFDPAKDDPKNVIESYERKMWSNPAGHLTLNEYESHSGSYIRSVARPIGLHDHPMKNPANENTLAKSYRRDHQILAGDLEQSFNVASPHEANFLTFGGQFEKIIYFACVGVESLFNKILTDNGWNRRRSGTSDFVKLLPLLRIDEYSLSVFNYPWMPLLIPFKGWDRNAPSVSLPWFDAYNQLKHNKETSRTSATMKNALDAAAGFYVLTFSVFGEQMFTNSFSEQFFFQFVSRPNWKIEERYFPLESEQWSVREIQEPQ